MEDINYWESKFEICCYSSRLLEKIDLLNAKARNKVNVNEIKKSIYYARKYHGIQKRQSGEPYYSHPLEVAYMYAEYAASDAPKYYKTDLIITCILHDTIEDTALTEEMISNIFGKKVANQVESLTRVKPYGKISSAEIINLLFEQKSREIVLIKLFDRLHNLCTIDAKSPDKIKKIIDETIKTFIHLSIHLEAPLTEKKLIEICRQYSFNLSKQNQKHQLFSFQENSRLLSLM